MGDDKRVYYYEYCLAKATLQWLVSIKILTIIEIKEIDKLNRISFNIPDEVPSIGE